MSESVVITGMGVMSPVGCDEESFWRSLCNGESGAAPVRGFDTNDLSRRLACQVKEPVEDLASIGRASALALAAARQAQQDARLVHENIRDARVSVTVGTTMGETQFIEDCISAPDSDWLNDKHMHRIMVGKPGSIARRVRDDLGFNGSALDLYGACAAGNLAIERAKRQLLDGSCDIAIAGGADGFSWLAFVGFMRLRVMAEEKCMPFDTRRDGLFVGEGAAVFVMERESDARARGVRIRARIAGASVACECYHPTRPHPDGDGLTRAAKGAIDDAGLTPSEIEYVCAHGTGTPQNDAIEVKVMEQCFPEGVAFSSVKALTGHTMGAAAAIEAACCILSIEHKMIVPTWNLEQILQPCALDPVMGKPRSKPIQFAMNNSAGFGGYNSSVIFAAA